MRVYISADMEGITGLVDAEDVQPPGRDYEYGRLMMTEDVNAAVCGALSGGATDVLVNDAHGPMRNLLPDQLHPRARLIKGRPKPMSMLEGLEADFGVALCVGFHARAGSPGVMSHSFMGHEIEDMRLDGRPVGEIGLFHATAAAIGVPVGLLSGDDAACAEMTEWDSGVTTVAVKTARDRFAAELRPPAESRAAIQAAAHSAVSRRLTSSREPAPIQKPATLAVRWQSAAVATHLLGIPGVTRSDNRTVEVAAQMPDLYRLLGIFLRVAATLTNQAPYC
ncbi:peptidase M55 [Streptomyces viridochromogenes]|uniref:Peptidase M55 n=1 Tax=Streptomyces viridochromogenes TaxID=1938 RepID=A0A0J7ZML2_STRVR|nr:M55 family metallopeptidase [Streptomyces viridochromogenes]KMS76622.1 peptidase M55 [Streptomyces viridochromogenes]KOG23396.1 peptidase M55 [Streptomyces viridochromogenes]KOG27358.1 peptidase M55 [Streptomyces viridochromogenes]